MGYLFEGFRPSGSPMPETSRIGLSFQSFLPNFVRDHLKPIDRDFHIEAVGNTNYLAWQVLLITICLKLQEDRIDYHKTHSTLRAPGFSSMAIQHCRGLAPSASSPTKCVFVVCLVVSQALSGGGIEVDAAMTCCR